jgi:DNA helicase IV
VLRGIDRVDGDLYYIGRRHVHDQNLDPVVIDWRAPVAEAFYQASWDDPWELERRLSFYVKYRIAPRAAGEYYMPKRALYSTRRGRSE